MHVIYSSSSFRGLLRENNLECSFISNLKLITKIFSYIQHLLAGIIKSWFVAF